MVQNWIGKARKSLTMVVFSAAVCGSTTAYANSVSVRANGNTLILRGDAAAKRSCHQSECERELGCFWASRNTSQRQDFVHEHTAFHSHRHVHGSGDDTVRFESINVPGNLEISLGSGNNRIFGNSTSKCGRW